MAITRCDKAHYYDDSRFRSCPFCESGGNGNGAGIDDQVTVYGSIAGRKLDHAAQRNVLEFDMTGGGDQTTIGLYASKGKLDPVVGWLVCVSGPEKGRDYRIHGGRNFLGRSLHMDIAIADDPEISRENHCSVAFDNKSGVFLLAPGISNTYLNGKTLTEVVTLSESDTITAGASDFVFVPFCSEGRKW